MKLITISGPPSSGKTSVILRLIESLREGGMEKIGVVKFDCLTSFDQVRYREAGIPVEIGFSGKVCPARLIGDGRWEEFCAAVEQRYEELKAAR